jgi:hypothetical protein
MMKCIIENSLSSNGQYEFMRGKIHCNALLKVLDLCNEILELGGQLDVIYIDFAKAFDEVSHRQLLAKLESYGFE